MSLKAIELQIALPRTQDAGKLQEQLQQRGQLASGLANDQIKKEEKQKRTSVIKHEQKSNVKLQQEDMDSNSLKEHTVQKKNNHNSTHEESHSTHPYKGTVIDFSG